MQYFTGLEYIDIAIANAYGLDHLTWKQRISWVKANPKIKVSKAKEPYQCMAAIKAKQDALAGIPIGFAMGLDATSSGIQIMALLSGDLIGARNCGLIKTKSRQDIHRNILGDLNQFKPNQHTRQDIKEIGIAVMYGSKAIPKKRLDSDEVEPFYKALEARLPITTDLLLAMLKTHSKVLDYTWTLPSGHVSHTKVFQSTEYTIDLPELGVPFKHIISENKPKEHDLSNAANIIHSIDSFIVSEINLRCKYDPEELKDHINNVSKMNLPELKYEGILSLNDLNKELPPNKAQALAKLCNKLLTYKPFDQYSIHDKFYASPNHMNKVREYIIDIYAELAESNLAQEILTQVQGYTSTFSKVKTNLPELIRKSEYIIS